MNGVGQMIRSLLDFIALLGIVIAGFGFAVAMLTVAWRLWVVYGLAAGPIIMWVGVFVMSIALAIGLIWEKG